MREQEKNPDEALSKSAYDFRGKRVRGIVELAIAHADNRSIARTQVLQAVAGMYLREIGDSKDDREMFLALAAGAWDEETKRL